MNIPIYLIFLFCIALIEKGWKFWRIRTFFSQPIPKPQSAPKLISILQPILSGDPTLSQSLEENLISATSYAREFIWLIDSDDILGLEICRLLVDRYSQEHIQLITLPPPNPNQNPKIIKLIRGVQSANGDIICVLDDDTSLSDFSFETCLPFLDQPNVGLVFGLPYYCTFQNIWSQLVSCFVNSHSLATYIPYLAFSKPLTINGMFYCLRRTVLDRIGGFEGLENILADDFAVSQRIRDHNLFACQAPLLHGIRTTVTNSRHYFTLIQRWFIFPRESIMRRLTIGEQSLVYGIALVPMFFIWLFIINFFLVPSPLSFTLCVLYIFLHYLTFAWINHNLLNSVTPWPVSIWVPVLQLLLPLQVIAALLSPRRIIWRGHLMESKPGGGLEFIQRRQTKENLEDEHGSRF